MEPIPVREMAEKSSTSEQVPAALLSVRGLYSAARGDVPMAEVKKKVENASKPVLEWIVISLTDSWRKLRDDLRRKEAEAKALEDLNKDLEQVVIQQKEAGDFLVREMENVAMKAEEMSAALNVANSRELQLTEKIRALEGEKTVLKARLRSISLELQAALQSLQESEDCLTDALSADAKNKLKAALDPSLARNLRLQKLVQQLLAAQDALSDRSVNQVPTALLRWVQDRPPVPGEQKVIAAYTEIHSAVSTTEQSDSNDFVMQIGNENENSSGSQAGEFPLHGLDDGSPSSTDCTLADLIAAFPSVGVSLTEHSNTEVSQSPVNQCNEGSPVLWESSTSLTCEDDMHAHSRLQFNEAEASRHTESVRVQGGRLQKDLIHTGVEVITEELTAAINFLNGSRGFCGMIMRIPFALVHLYFGLSWRALVGILAYSVSVFKQCIPPSPYTS